MQHKTIKSSIQAMKATSEYTLRGKGVVYGGRDLQHETFTRDTDFGGSRSFVGMPVYYDHHNLLDLHCSCHDSICTGWDL